MLFLNEKLKSFFYKLFKVATGKFNLICSFSETNLDNSKHMKLQYVFHILLLLLFELGEVDRIKFCFQKISYIYAKKDDTRHGQRNKNLGFHPYLRLLLASTYTSVALVN